MKVTDAKDFEKENVFGTGEPNTAYAKFFVGNSFLNPLTLPTADFLPQMSLLNPDAAITGISITLQKAADSF